MTRQQREKQLANAQTQLKNTTRKIARLMTAQRNWRRRIEYHRRQLEKETLAMSVAAANNAVALVQGTAQPLGRKFRD